MNMRSHLTGMLLAGAAVLAVALLAGFPLGAALPYAALLACPLMMIAMMVMMTRGSGHGGGQGSPGHGNGSHDHSDNRLGDDRPDDAAPAWDGHRDERPFDARHP